MTPAHNSSASTSSSLAPTLQFASGSMAPQVHDRGNHVSTTGGSVYTIHTYGLKEYAYVFINSHADSPQDTPVIYRGEETTGTVRLPQRSLQEVQSIIVVVRRLLAGMIVIELDIYSCGCSILTSRIRHIRQRWCCFPDRLIPLIS
jgi:hypothetical protein